MFESIRDYHDGAEAIVYERNEETRSPPGRRKKRRVKRNEEKNRQLEGFKQ
jgi:hypothetical protein